MSGVAIIGAGHAGAHTAIALRAAGYRGPVTLVGDEPAIPYNRPPLSKQFLQPGPAEPQLAIRPDDFWREHEIDLRLGNRAAHVDRAKRAVELTDGGTIEFGHLVLATGSRARTMNAPGGFRTLRTVDDAVAIRESLGGSSRVVIVGAGFVGLELAAAARALGAEVTVIEAATSVLARVLSEQTADHVRSVHERHGVKFVMGRAVRALTERSVALDSGDEIVGDLIVVGIGAVPNVDLARSAGLAVSDGVVVDEFLRTSDPDIFAIGDCARFPCAVSGKTLRLESIQNGTDQARYIADSVVGLPSRPYRAVPYFWTQQFSHKVMIAGVAGRADRSILRGDPDSDSFSVWRYDDDGKLTAVESVNAPADHVQARRLLEAGATERHPDH